MVGEEVTLVALAKKLLEEIEEYIDEEPDMTKRLQTEAELRAIVERIRDLNLRCVP